MRTLFFIFAMFVIAVSAYSQTYIDAYHREYCYYNSATDKYDDCYGYDEESLFEVATDWSYWVHTTPNMSSTYYVDDVEYNAEIGFDIYYVTSDAGNIYMYVFDPVASEIRILGTNKEGQSFLLTFYTAGWNTQ